MSKGMRQRCRHRKSFNSFPQDRCFQKIAGLGSKISNDEEIMLLCILSNELNACETIAILNM